MELNDFIEKFAEQFEDTAMESLNADTKFRELDEWTSLIALMVIGMIDEEFGVALEAKDMRQATTIGELFELLKSKL